MCKRYFHKSKGNAVWLFSRGICQGTLVKRRATLQLSIGKILARGVSGHWKLKSVFIRESVSLGVRLFEYSVLSEYFSVHYRR